jgi:hypothetical protein
MSGEALTGLIMLFVMIGVIFIGFPISLYSSKARVCRA